jgi:hypothetical protein
LPSRCAGRQFRLHRLKHGLIHDGLVLAGVDFAAVDHFPNVEAIAQEVSKGTNSEPYAASGPLEQILTVTGTPPPPRDPTNDDDDEDEDEDEEDEDQPDQPAVVRDAAATSFV